MKNVKNVFYLAGPFGLIAFALMDYLGGKNYPGFNWLNQTLTDLTAIDSYCLPISLTFSIIAGILIIVGAYLSYKFFKGFKTNKGFVKGMICVLVTALIVGAGMNILLVPQAGTSSIIRDTVVEIKAQNDTIATSNKNIAEAEKAEDTSEEATVETTATDTSTVSSTSSSESVISSNQATIDTANQKLEELNQKIIDLISNPLLAGKIACIGLLIIMFVISCLVLAISGLKKKGIKTIGIFSIVLLASFIAAIVVDCVFVNTWVGITVRWMSYCPFLLVAFISGWIYVYEPARK